MQSAPSPSSRTERSVRASAEPSARLCDVNWLERCWWTEIAWTWNPAVLSCWAFVCSTIAPSRATISVTAFVQETAPEPR